VARRKHGASGLDKLQRAWISPPKDRPWTRLFLDVIEGEAWRGLSINARRVHDALTCWFIYNQQQENGEIRLSYRQLESSGVARKSVAQAIRELQDAGFISTARADHANGHEVLTLGPDHETRPILYRLHVYDKAKSDGLLKTAARPFAFVTIEVMESREWRGLSINARRIVERLLIANRRLCYEKNGALRVSFAELAKHDVGWRFITGAIKELVKTGLLAVRKGKRRGLKSPSCFYRLTFLGTVENPATWKPSEPGVTAPKRQQKGKSMRTKTFFPPPKGDTELPPKGDTAESRFPPPKGDTANGDSPLPKGDTFILSCLGTAETAAIPSFSCSDLPEPEKERARVFGPKLDRQKWRDTKLSHFASEAEDEEIVAELRAAVSSSDNPRLVEMVLTSICNDHLPFAHPAGGLLNPDTLGIVPVLARVMARSAAARAAKEPQSIVPRAAQNEGAF
jgi:hypothetical protein